jgi:hypothetical protein
MPGGVKGTFPAGWKPSPHQHAYRIQEEIRLWQDGCTVNQIAVAVGCNDGTVRKDLRNNGVRMGARGKRVKVTRPDPPRVDWLHPPQLLQGPSDRPALAVRHFTGEMAAARYAAAHAADLLEARLNGDEGWEESWLQDIGRLRQITGTLERLHSDEAYLRACALGRTVEEDSERVHEGGQGVRRITKAVEAVVHEIPGPRRLGGDVEDREQHDRPRDDPSKHLTILALPDLAANGLRR